jgi:hypothetical protein
MIKKDSLTCWVKSAISPALLSVFSLTVVSHPPSRRAYISLQNGSWVSLKLEQCQFFSDVLVWPEIWSFDGGNGMGL